MGENERPNTGGKLLKIVGGVLIVIVLIIVGAAIVVRFKNKPVQEPIAIEVQETVGETEVKGVVEVEVEEDEKEVEKDVGEKKDELDYGYDNKVLGMRFNFDRSLYIKENTDELYNTLKEYTQEGKNFNISIDKVEEMINIVKATTGEVDGVAITVGIMPFELGEVVKEDGADPIQVSELLKEGLILDKYDKQIEAKIIEQGGEVDLIEPSEITEQGYMISERRYIDKDGKLVETKQAIIPAGVNAVVVTLVSDGRPLEYSKEDMFNIIVESIEIDVKDVEIENTKVIKDEEGTKNEDNE